MTPKPLRLRLRDWWRGYTDADYRHLLLKIFEAKAGQAIPVTHAEALAYQEFCRHFESDIAVKEGL